MSTKNIEKELLFKLQPALDAREDQSVIEILDDYRAEDIAEIFWDITLDEAKYIIKIIEKPKAIETIRSLDEELQGRFFKGYTANEIASDVIAYLDSDDAVDILNLLSTRKAEEVITFLDDQEYAKNLISMLHYDDDVAGGLMAKELVKVKYNWTVSQCVEEIRKQAEEVTNVLSVYVVDDKDILKGVVSLKDIVLAKAHTSVIEITNDEYISINAYATGEEVASYRQFGPLDWSHYDR